MSENHKGKDLKLRRRVRPRYNKLLIPALIISLIIAVILILLWNKYLFKPVFEEKGSLHPKTPVVVERIVLHMQNLEAKAIL